jgi:glyoxylase-like metal-dependent hydrolase (beta-lactamase superfamily II)
MHKTFITTMPDKPGAFLQATRALLIAGVNITRVSYNKAIDTNLLFIEVSGSESDIAAATEELSKIGYLPHSNTVAKVILIEFKLLDKPGTLAPILEIISSYNFNISYISSQQNKSEYQYFKMGLYIENTASMKSFLEQVSHHCEVKIIDYDKTEKNLDNTVFYLSFAREIADKLSLDQATISALISDSNLVMQMLDEKNLSPYKTFEYIAKFADSLAKYKGNNFLPRVQKERITGDIILYLIEPPCGSNTYILHSRDRLLFIDSGFACYRDEMLRLFHAYFPDFDTMKKQSIITHADIDHCGLLDLFDEVYLSKTSYDNFVMEKNGESNFREQNPAHAPYVRISKILSGYKTPPLEKLRVLDTSAPDTDKALSLIGSLNFADMKFDIYQGIGGHVNGEIVLVGEKERIAFTGDIIVNPPGFTKEQTDFNSLAPYLMTSVNMNSSDALKTRKAVLRLLSGNSWLICGGHGSFYRTEN